MNLILKERLKGLNDCKKRDEELAVMFYEITRQDKESLAKRQQRRSTSHRRNNYYQIVKTKNQKKAEVEELLDAALFDSMAGKRR